MSETEHLKILFSEEVVNRKYGYFERPVFNKQKILKTAAKDQNWLWVDFERMFDPFARIDLSQHTDSDSEVLFTRKDVGWSTRDVNIWIGGNRRDINEIPDLTDQEGTYFFQQGLTLCRQLSQLNDHNYALSIGFNPRDLGMPGHHNIKRLHAHLRAYDDPLDIDSIKLRSWKEMTWFDRLTFTEPFARPYYDFMTNYHDNVGSAQFPGENIELNSGFISSYINPKQENAIFSSIKPLYSAMRAEYEGFQDVFTDKRIDSESGRYIPYPKPKRQRKFSELLKSYSCYSDQSLNLLEYLVDNLYKAAARPSNRGDYIQEPSQLYITKGFSGAITFTYLRETDSFRMDFLPRVITSSAVAKTIFGIDRPTLMGAHVTATDTQRMAVTTLTRQINEVIPTILN